MPTGHEFDAIVRIDPGVPTDPSCQVVVAIDLRTGEPARGGLWPGRAKKQQKSLLITNSHRVNAVAVRRGLKISIEDFSRDMRFDLVVDYEARCNPGREVRVAQALWSGPSPQECFEALLKGWVLQRLEGRIAEFVREFDRSAERLSEEIRARAAEQTGLTLALRVGLADADRLDPIRLGPLTIQVSVRDHDDEVELRVEVDLAVEKGKEQIAYLYRDDHASLNKEIQRRIREHFATEVTLHQLHTELAERVQRELSQHLNEFLESHGRRIVRLSLRGPAFPNAFESKKLEHTFSHRLGDYPEPVEIRTEILLQLADLGRYLRANAPDLKGWANHEVELAAGQALFGVTYTDLCLHYEEKKREIEQRMRERAATIGYELKQFITITDLQFDILRRPFLVQVEGEFATQLAKLRVRLEVNSTLFVPHPNEIASLLDRRVDVKEQIRVSLYDRIQQKLHQVNPESFYMEFETAEGRPPVREQLEALITETLAREFHAQVLSLSCKQLETELSRRLERLMGPLHVFSVEIVASRGGPPVVFDASFRVDGVDGGGWVAFQTSSPDPEMVCASAIRHLRHLLADEALARLLQTSNVDQRKEVDRSVQARLMEEFGLRVRVMDWLRRPLAQEQHASQVRLALVDNLVDDSFRRDTEKIELVHVLQASSDSTEAETAESRRLLLHELQKRLRLARIDGESPEEERELCERIARVQDEQKKTLEAAEGRSKMILPHLQSARSLLIAGTDATPPENDEGVEANQPDATDPVSKGS